MTDHRRKLYIDKLGETIEAHPDFSMIVSFNPGYQKGFKELKPSTKQRFVALSFHYPSEKAEVEILLNETKIDENTWKASGMLDLYQLELEMGMLDLDLVHEDSGYFSVAGLILDKTQGEVKQGTQIEHDGIWFEVLEMDENRIKWVKITKPESRG